MMENSSSESEEKAKESTYKSIYYSFQGFWIAESATRSVLSFQNNFEALDDDVIVGSCPKSGTTWLKALAFSIVHRHTIPLPNSPLLSSLPHEVVPTLELDVFDNNAQSDVVDLGSIPHPRLLGTHVPYEALPASIKSSKCKMVYIWRNPMDQAVSLWHFVRRYMNKDKDGESETQQHYLDQQFFDMFCEGMHWYGPFWDHVLGFWRAKQERPDKIMFVKYEELKQDTPFHVKRLAEFLGSPFSEAEEKQGVAEQIAQFCSIESMKSFKGNSDGFRRSGLANNSYFRKGQVGDWANHLTPSMADRLEKIIREKFHHSGLQI